MLGSWGECVKSPGWRIWLESYQIGFERVREKTNRMGYRTEYGALLDAIVDEGDAIALRYFRATERAWRKRATAPP
jgi:hypothetical protein